MGGRVRCANVHARARVAGGVDRIGGRPESPERSFLIDSDSLASQGGLEPERRSVSLLCV